MPRPWLPLPICQRLATIDQTLIQALPVDAAIRGQSHIGEHRVLSDRVQGVRVCVGRGARRHAKEALLGVDGPEDAGGIELHPGDVVAHALDLPVGQGGRHHGQVGLAARGRKGGGHVPVGG